MLRLLSTIALIIIVIAIPYPVKEFSGIAYWLLASFFVLLIPSRGPRTSAKELIWGIGATALAFLVFFPWYVPLALAAKAVALVLMLLLFVLTEPKTQNV